MSVKIFTNAQHDKAIVDLYNEHAKAYAEAKGQPGALLDESFHAFICNAINMAVTHSSRAILKAVFQAEAITE